MNNLFKAFQIFLQNPMQWLISRGMNVPQNLAGNPNAIIQQEFQIFLQNPMQWLISHGTNVPQELTNNPDAIIQHLMNTGQLTQDQYNQARQMRNQFR